MGDDFTRTHFWSFDSYFAQIIKWYQEHNGRYFNALLTNIPFFYLPYIYKLTFLIFGGFFIVTFKKLTQTILPTLRAKQQWIISATIFSILILITPSVLSGYYWFAGVTVYLFSFSCLVLIFTHILSYQNGCHISNIDVIKLSLLIFAAVGSSELTMLVLLFLLGIILCRSIIRQDQTTQILLLNIVTWVCSSIVFASAYTTDRQRGYEGLSLTDSIISASVGVFEYLFKYLLTEPIFILASVLVFSLLIKHIKAGDIKYPLRPLLAFGIVVVVLFINLLLLNYAQGKFNIDEAHRTNNMVLFYFSISWILFLISLAKTFSSNGIVKQIFIPSKALAYLPLILFIMPFISKNYNNVLTDLSNGIAKDYSNFRMARVKYAKDIKNEELIILPQNLYYPKTISRSDLSKDSTHWVCRGYANYIHTTSRVICNTKMFIDSCARTNSSLKNQVYVSNPWIKANSYNTLMKSLFDISKNDVVVLSRLKKGKEVHNIQTDGYNSGKLTQSINHDWMGDQKTLEIDLKGQDFDSLRVKKLIENKIVWQQTLMKNP